MTNSKPTILIMRILWVALLCCSLATVTICQTSQPTPIPIAGAPESPAQLRQETFELVWKPANRNFYDPNFNGVDWKAIHDRYAPRVAATTSDAELYSLLQLMVNELHQSHFWVIAPQAIPKLRPKPKHQLEDSGEDLADEPD